MTLEIELDSFNHLDNGDCIEICGVITNDIFQVVFSSKDKPRFKFNINPNNGWDVYTWDKTSCDIDSGSNYSFLEYEENNQFTICFHIKCNQISILLNDNLLSKTQSLSMIEEIHSIKISGDNMLKYISFSDCSKKTSRVLQPAIHKSLDCNLNVDTDSVSIIESRKRIIFKSKFPDHERDCLSESDDQSEDEVIAMEVTDDNFKHLNSILLNRTMSNDDDIYQQYPNDIPENKYVLNYFYPTDNISDTEDNLMNSFKQKVLEMENSNTTKKRTDTFNEIKCQLENIWKNLENTSYDIEKFQSTPNLSSTARESLGLSAMNLCKTFRIPILKKDSPPVKLQISNHRTNVYQKSKIPILLIKPPSISENNQEPTVTIQPTFDISKKRTYKLTKKTKKSLKKM